MNKRLRVIAALACSVALVLVQGCADPAADPAPLAGTAPATAAEAVPVSGIDWFAGDVDAAFTAARSSGKPVFLYWGAEWCPPCHLVKATVFKSRSFIERSRLFIPVYLDGDTANAQALGERFGVLGYPTMILFRPDGEEITRIPGSSDVTAYANALDVSLQSQTAVAALLQAQLATPRPLSVGECGQLAFHSWGQDQSILADHDPVAVHRQIFNQCPTSATLARATAWMTYLGAAVAATSDEAPFSLTDEQRAAAIVTTRDLLADDAAVRANLYPLLFDGAPITALLTVAGSDERAALTRAFVEVYRAIADDPQIFWSERLYAQYGRLAFERIEDGERPPSAALRADIVAAVNAAHKATTDVYARQSVMNTANNVLMDAGLLSDSKALLVREIGISKQPYYFMVALADVEQELGNVTDAIGWLRRAWEVSDGAATRFQWGNYYIAGLIEMAPEQTDLIRDTVLQVFDELAQTKAFYQRPRRQLARLKQRLATWSEDPATAAAMSAIRDRVSAVCATLPDEDAAKATCLSFLSA